MHVLYSIPMCLFSLGVTNEMENSHVKTRLFESSHSAILRSVVRAERHRVERGRLSRQRIVTFVLHVIMIMNIHPLSAEPLGQSSL